jgi:asparagine N-glycosylation enzyme membrane subunit Stt3
MAGAIRAAGIFVDPDLAERIVIAVWPAFLMAVFVLGMLVLAAPVFSPATLLAAAAIIALNSQFLFQFLPGRIDHHGVQMVLVLLLAGATIAALAAASRGAAIVAGSAAALSMAIGLGALPVIAAAVMLFGAAWIVRGDDLRRVVGAFGASFALATPLLFTATIAPAQWAFTACDALSPPWLCGLPPAAGSRSSSSP